MLLLTNIQSYDPSYHSIDLFSPVSRLGFVQVTCYQGLEKANENHLFRHVLFWSLGNVVLVDIELIEGEYYFLKE